MPVLALHHAQVFYPAGEEARARRFYYAAAKPSRGASSAYGAQLGLREIERPRSLQGQAGLWFEVPGGAHVHLAVEPDLALHPRRHFALRVDDVARMRRELKTGRCYYAAAKRSRGASSAYVFDPFGNKIELDQIP